MIQKKNDSELQLTVIGVRRDDRRTCCRGASDSGSR